MASLSSRASQRPQPPAVSGAGRRSVAQPLRADARGRGRRPRRPARPARCQSRSQPCPPPCRTALVINSLTASTKSSSRWPARPEACAQEVTEWRSSVTWAWSKASAIRREGVDGHNRTRCVGFCVRHGPVPTVGLGRVSRLFNRTSGFLGPHSLPAARAARLWHRDRHAVAAGWIRGARSGGRSRCSASPPWRTSARSSLRDADRYAHPVAAGVRPVLVMLGLDRRRPRVGYARPALAALAAAAGRPRRRAGRRAGPPRGWSGGRRSPPVCPSWRSPGWPGRCWPGRSPAAGGGARWPRCWSAGADLATRDRIGQSSLTGAILMLLAGVVVGHVARLAATPRSGCNGRWSWRRPPGNGNGWPATSTTRCSRCWRWCSGVARTCDGEAGELARLAGEQEAALRALIAGSAPAGAAGPDRPDTDAVDLRALLGRYASTAVSLSAPATPVPAAPAGGPGAGRRDRARRWTTWPGTPAGGPGCWSRTRGRR